MKITILVIFLQLILFSSNALDVIRINQLGYLPHSKKVAVFISDKKCAFESFTIRQSVSNKVIFEGKIKATNASNWGMKTAFRLDFSACEKSGSFYVEAGSTKSSVFRISPDVYAGTADFILNYLRQQRCGYNPFLKDSCHVHDGIIVDHPEKTGLKIDVTGGWHDASDYLQYATTSVNATFQMMFAYQNFPEIFSDEFNERGEKGNNKIPDILDEIKWGLEWMIKMNPAPEEMYNQIADDRDHVGYRLPNHDSADYDLGEYRPVYFVTGKPQGLSKYKNQSTGVSSIAAKFASGYALAAQLFQNIDTDFSDKLRVKAVQAWNFALSDTGYCQTACNVSPYFYEERNFTDDLELAAVQLYKITNDKKYLAEAKLWGNQEPVSPWIKNGIARHYESYPFINLGHYFLGKEKEKQFSAYYSNGLDSLYQRGMDDPFFNGLPFIWCSNNLVAAALTQAVLYRELTDDSKYAEMEAALRDWLFGCNPWGTAMICGLPGVADSPLYPHSSITVLYGETTFGGLVDGPVSSSIFEGLIGIQLTKDDDYQPFNKGKAVYHDDPGDYSTNEPTMDGTASLSYLLAYFERMGREQKNKGF